MVNHEIPNQERESNGGYPRPDKIPPYEEGSSLLFDDEFFDTGYKEASMQAQIKLEDGDIEGIMQTKRLLVDSINNNLNTTEADIDEGMNRYGQIRAIRDLIEAHPSKFKNQA